ncbi:hypothetical protein JTB14_018165 [Gonioctena quinquepunctata]|nr:hypothetical protein JTB14_018165 [Gonioctena quinquepunctata]
MMLQVIVETYLTAKRSLARLTLHRYVIRARGRLLTSGICPSTSKLFFKIVGYMTVSAVITTTDCCCKESINIVMPLLIKQIQRRTNTITFENYITTLRTIVIHNDFIVQVLLELLEFIPAPSSEVVEVTTLSLFCKLSSKEYQSERELCDKCFITCNLNKGTWIPFNEESWNSYEEFKKWQYDNNRRPALCEKCGKVMGRTTIYKHMYDVHEVHHRRISEDIWVK